MVPKSTKGVKELVWLPGGRAVDIESLYFQHVVYFSHVHPMPIRAASLSENGMAAVVQFRTV